MVLGEPEVGLPAGETSSSVDSEGDLGLIAKSIESSGAPGAWFGRVAILVEVFTVEA